MARRRAREADGGRMKRYKGFAVEIERSEGNTFLALTDVGMLPFVTASKTSAIKFKEELEAHQFKARVVRVNYTLPVVIKKASKP